MCVYKYIYIYDGEGKKESHLVLFLPSFFHVFLASAAQLP